MVDNQDPNPKPQVHPPSSSPSPTSNSRFPGEVGGKGSSTNGYTKPRPYPNPPDATNPDAATLRDQWKFAIRQYSRWYSHAWGTAILAGISFFALGWIIKGSNPIRSFAKDKDQDAGHDVPSPPVPPTLTASPSDGQQTPKS
ncbi:uncharacterized protein LOC127808686 [Diospyros lotus]|uniref:uncharacterized protein LOC127808686 n=1 Tax=Diospyros lotus TaxID=55363 RepID=UPI002257B6C9|nr:uncharacterized protein LOC127808686 [Diospyros lotus]